LLHDRLVEACPGKTANAFICIVHRQCNTIAFKIINFVFYSFSIFTFKPDRKFSFSFCQKIRRTILIAEGVTANTNRGCPVWD
jgi:hypothetical protein